MGMTQQFASSPAKPRIRPLSIEARQRRAALKRPASAEGQVFTDWAAI